MGADFAVGFYFKVSIGLDDSDWLLKTINSVLTAPITTHTINVMLLNEKGSPLKTWTFHDAWPVKWSLSEFNVQEAKLAIESIEFAYSGVDDQQAV
ncbi:MAG: phage tail protein [Rudanella sp.]|nr:phage tail protein [Rudanella sp.]